VSALQVQSHEFKPYFEKRKKIGNFCFVKDPVKRMKSQSHRVEESIFKTLVKHKIYMYNTQRTLRGSAWWYMPIISASWEAEVERP
jgi:hypothetical protein